MVKVVIKYLGFTILIVNFTAAQDDQQSINSDVKNTSIIKLDQAETKQPVKETGKKIMDNPDLVLNRLRTPPQPQQYEFEFPGTIISSFNSNFHFAGLWDKYAVINVTPQMFIKPFEFLSIYANHSTSMYIPITEVKQHFRSLLIEGAAVLAVDNSVKLIFSSTPMLQSIVNFAAKNLVINFLKRSLSGNKFPEFKYYYYAVSVRF